jgi:chemotaxis protein histidine kinase CheA
MSQYKRPIQVRQDDPICSVSALEGTVIGILFEKTGKEIKEAIGRRTTAIDGRVTECESVIGTVREFLKGKETQIKELEEVKTAREDDRKAKMRPHERQIEDVFHRMRMESHDHAMQTEKLIAEKATTFADKFDEHKDNFKAVDEFLEEKYIDDQVELLSTRSMSSGWQGCQGSQGAHGSQGWQGYVGSKKGKGGAEEFSDEEDQALARLNTLKNIVRVYLDRVNRIVILIEQLKEEKRRLSLIERNLDEKRAYKLDLNKLSAFGFEDVDLLAGSVQK